MNSPKEAAAPASNFLRHIVERDLQAGTYATRTFAGTPGDAAHHAGAPRTRRGSHPLSAEPTATCTSAARHHLNFGLAQEYGGICHLRFDDTNPEKKSRSTSTQSSTQCAGSASTGMPRARAPGTTTSTSPATISTSCTARPRRWSMPAAYVDEQSADEIRAHRGDFATPGRTARSASARRPRTAPRQMKPGAADGAAVLRQARQRPDINLRDPVIYIKRATHHNTGDRWCIYRCTPTPIRSRTRWRTSRTRSAPSSSGSAAVVRLASTTLRARSGPAAAASVRVRAPQRHYVIRSKRKLKHWSTKSSPAGTIRACRRSPDCAAALHAEALRLMRERAGTSKAAG
jgi:hypothetical protein